MRLGLPSARSTSAQLWVRSDGISLFRRSRVLRAVLYGFGFAMLGRGLRYLIARE